VKQLGYTDAQIAEIFMVVGLFNHTNVLMHGLQHG
jgi:alkylhydroperoxidase family enzyme